MLYIIDSYVPRVHDYYGWQYMTIMAFVKFHSLIDQIILVSRFLVIPLYRHIIYIYCA